MRHCFSAKRAIPWLADFMRGDSRGGCLRLADENTDCKPIVGHFRRLSMRWDARPMTGRQDSCVAVVSIQFPHCTAGVRPLSAVFSCPERRRAAGG